MDSRTFEDFYGIELEQLPGVFDMRTATEAVMHMADRLGRHINVQRVKHWSEDGVRYTVEWDRSCFIDDQFDSPRGGDIMRAIEYAGEDLY